jgi:hypothetical protein
LERERKKGDTERNRELANVCTCLKSPKTCNQQAGDTGDMTSDLKARRVSIQEEQFKSKGQKTSVSQLMQSYRKNSLLVSIFVAVSSSIDHMTPT